jgi:hypothetical protein
MTQRSKPIMILAGAVLAGACHAMPAGAQDEKFYAIEAFTIVSKLEGMRSGTKTVHTKNWGRTRVEIEDATMNMMGVTRAEKKRVIMDGRNIATIDEAAKTVTTTVNPTYDRIATSVKGKDGAELGRAFMSSLGHTPTGAKGSYGGEACDVWSNAQLGQELCVTSDGLVVFIRMNLMGVSMTETATEVRRGDGGPDSAYAMPNYPTSQMPNLGDLMKRGAP